jgi:cytochrome c biogenesis protein CcmG/thiol:disulfide interchange protein DsbE
MNDHKGQNPYDDVAKRTTGHHPKLGLMIAGGTLAVLVVVGVVAYFLTRPDDSGGSVKAGSTGAVGAAAARNATQETGKVVISGEDLPPLPDSGGMLPAAGQDQGVGLVAPKLEGESFDGSKVVVDPKDGRPKVVMFVAHWCPHCQKEVPLVQEWIASGKKPDGVDVYMVSTGVSQDKPNYPPSKWLAGVGWQPPVLADDQGQSAAQSYGLTGFPYFVMVDKDGKVWQRGSGEIPIDQFDQLVNELAKGQAPTGTGGSTGNGSSSKVSIPPTSAPSGG